MVGSVLAWWSPEAWAAIATWLAVIGAAGATWFASGQVKEARQIRLEQSQPQVIVFFEPSKIGHIFMDLVIRNIGPAVALDVRVAFQPGLRSTIWESPSEKNPAKSKLLTEGTATLVPGMEHRLLFERGPDLVADPTLPRSYNATVSYRDARGSTFEHLYTLDLEAFFAGSQLAPKDIHDVAKALEEISKTLKKMGPSLAPAPRTLPPGS